MLQSGRVCVCMVRVGGQGKEDRMCHFQVEGVLRQNLFIVTYIGWVIWSGVNAPAPLSRRCGIISILCCSGAELF